VILKYVIIQHLNFVKGVIMANNTKAMFKKMAIHGLHASSNWYIKMSTNQCKHLYIEGLGTLSLSLIFSPKMHHVFLTQKS